MRANPISRTLKRRRPASPFRAGLAVACLGLSVPGLAFAQSACPSRGWVALPSADDMTDVYPRSPMFEATEGHVTLACRAGGDGTISGCSIEAEAPVDLGFGKAALQLAKKIKA